MRFNELPTLVMRFNYTCQDIAREKSAGLIAGISASSTFQVELLDRLHCCIFTNNYFDTETRSLFEICNSIHVLVQKAKLGKAFS